MLRHLERLPQLDNQIDLMYCVGVTWRIAPSPWLAYHHRESVVQ